MDGEVNVRDRDRLSVIKRGRYWKLIKPCFSLLSSSASFAVSPVDGTKYVSSPPFHSLVTLLAQVKICDRVIMY
jgi:hypothetical protein